MNIISEFDKLINCGNLSFNDPIFKKVDQTVNETSNELLKFNNATSTTERLEILKQITHREVPDSTVINPPYQTDFGANTFLGKNVFINRDCTLVDLGGIYLADNVLLAPHAMIISVNHNENPAHRRDLVLKSVHIQKNAWIGANAIILPGVTVGENAIVGAGSVVTKNVPADSIVAGDPAKFIRKIKK